MADFTGGRCWLPRRRLACCWRCARPAVRGGPSATVQGAGTEAKRLQTSPSQLLPRVLQPQRQPLRPHRAARVVSPSGLVRFPWGKLTAPTPEQSVPVLWRFRTANQR